MADVYQLHDCSNLPAVPCQTPPKLVAHAKAFESRYYRSGGELVSTPCKNAVTVPLSTYNALCSIECDFGYELFENDFQCEERGNPLSYSWSQMTGSATCTPVVCGVPMDRLHTRHPYTSVVYPLTAEYNCDVGYTLDHDPHGLKQFTITCEGNASFSGYQDCIPVLCGQCPRADADHVEKYAHSVPIEEADRYFMNMQLFV